MGFHREAGLSTVGGFLTQKADLVKKSHLLSQMAFLYCVADLDARGFCRGYTTPLAMMGVKSIRVLPDF